MLNFVLICMGNAPKDFLGLFSHPLLFRQREQSKQCGQATLSQLAPSEHAVI